MEFKELNDPDHPFEFKFDGWELVVLRAAYTEHSILLERAGNSSSISDFDRYIVTYPEDKRSIRRLMPSSPESICSVLEEFHEATDERAREIAYLPLPEFANRYSADRRQLGEWAIHLAKEITKSTTKSAVPPPLPKPESVDIDAELVRFLRSTAGEDPV